jgi:hypothetical protein
VSLKPPLPIWLQFSCLGLLILPGCVTPQKRIAREMPALRSQWQADVAHQSALPERRVSWLEALALLEKNNLKLRGARVDITNSEEIARQVYRDLIPTVNLRSGVTKSVKNLPATSFDDVTFNIDSFFNIPGVVNFNARLFSGRLSVMRAKAACQIAEREQTIELYKLFLEARENDEQAAELKTERSVAEAVRKADEISGEVLLKDVIAQEALLAKTDESFQTRIGDLLAERRFHWVLSTNGFPEFDYAAHPLPLEDTNRVAQLQMKMVALELVGDWAQVHGIKLQYWPELSFFVTGPSAFQFANGQGNFASAANVVGSADFFWSLDTRGYVSQQLRTTRRAQDLEKAQLQMDALALIDQLIAARKTEVSLREQAVQLDRLLAFLDKVPPDVDVNSILQRAETNRSLHFQRARLRRDMAELNTLFWFVDEQKWAEQPKELCLNH